MTRAVSHAIRRTGWSIVLAAIAAATATIAHTGSVAVRAAQQRPAASASTSAARVDRDELMRIVRTLSQAAFEGRRTGTEGNRRARQFIRDEFEQIGVAPAAADFAQPFTFTRPSGRGPRTGSAAGGGTYHGTNLLATQQGSRPDVRTIVISAHYDHLGVVNGVTYPGADDNASGVAAMLATARYVHSHPLQHRTIFAALDAEELGLQGARAFVRSPPVELSTIALDVNFDMVSRNDRNEIYAAGTFQNPSLSPTVTDIQRRARVKVLLGHDQPKTRGADDWTLQSDHGVFHQAGVPFIYFGVEDHPDYHKPTDTADKIDQKFFGEVVEMLIDFVVTVDQRLP